jgi:hypothetical protein
MMPNPPKSESPDEFLKQAGLPGYDPTLTEPGAAKPSINKDMLGALHQPKDGTESKDCKDCE